MRTSGTPSAPGYLPNIFPLTFFQTVWENFYGRQEWEGRRHFAAAQWQAAGNTHTHCMPKQNNHVQLTAALTC